MDRHAGYLKNRFILVALLVAIFVAVSFLTRTLLLVTDFRQVDLNMLAVLRVYSTGLLYDLVAALYYVSPFVLYLIIVPDKIFHSKIHYYLSGLFLYVQIYGLVFGLFSEWFFWNEFAKRFNFIAVDYLVYTHEVIYNILESYPVPLLLAVILAISTAAFYLIYKKMPFLKYSFLSNQTFLSRLKTGSILLLLPVICFYSFNKQSLADVSANQYNNELAKNGLYSLFSAYRNNTLDYEVFYPKRDLPTIMQHLYRLTGFNDQKQKIIKKEGEEKQFNIMLVMVESLSAEYMGVFGNPRNLTPRLDALIGKSLFFDNFYATGTRTVRGMEAVILSIPPTPGRSVVKRPDNEGLFS
ncbi:MAG: sulfatase, partial [Deltaproteobacteria bacterium]